MSQPTKYCSYRKHQVPVNLMCRNRSKPDGLDDYCRDCKAEYQAARRKIHTTENQRIVDSWKAANPLRSKAVSGAAALNHKARALGHAESIKFEEVLDVLNQVDSCECGATKQLCISLRTPLEDGGRIVKSNVRIICRSCLGKEAHARRAA